VCQGPSRVYVAPIVNKLGNYEVRVFVLCFDASQLYIWDPNATTVDNQINVGIGPSAMAFDPFCTAASCPGPFDLSQVAANDPVPTDTRYSSDITLKTYRYAYLSSFTHSYVQVIDLDASNPQTFERVVYTLGQPTPPKGQ
jgi:hypothetical protein